MQSTAKRPRNKPPRPAGFPLFAHQNGQWAKKVKGKLYYFGLWSDPAAALERWLHDKDPLLAGRTPRPKSDQLTLRDLVNRFLTSKKHRVDSGELSPRSWRDCDRSCAWIVAEFGRNRLVDDLTADDFERLRRSLSKTRKALAVGNEIGRIRSVFKYGFECGLLEQPVRFGPGFQKPNRKTVRLERQAKTLKNGERMFESEELRTIIAEAPQPLKAMILLGANCGYGQSDIGCLTHSAIDLETNWCEHPRPKTAVERRCPLWPETIAALREVVEGPQREPKDDADRGIVFLTSHRRRWSYTSPAGSPVDNCGSEFSKLLKRLNLKRPGRSFYALRHGFETIGSGAKDQTAVDFLMGHTGQSMSAAYRERIEDSRLVAVTEHVHAWLFPEDSDDE